MHYIFHHVIYVCIRTDSMSSNQRLDQFVHVRPLYVWSTLVTFETNLLSRAFPVSKGKALGTRVVPN